MARLKIGSLQHKRSSVVNDNTPKLPTAEQLVYGEIAINYAKDYETLSIKNSSGDVVTFSSDSIIYNNVDNKIGTVAEGKTVVGMIDDAQSAAEGHADSVKSELLGGADDDYNTLGKLKNKIIAAEAAAKAAATKLDKANEASHLTLTSVTSTSGEITYTIGEDNIASASDLTAEVTRAKAAEKTNADAIAAEVTRAEGKEGELTTAIDEVERNLSVETQTRTTEIERLENLIGNIEAGISDATEVKVSSGTSHIKIESGATDGKVTYTISEVDIASAAVLAEVKEDVDNFFNDADFTANAKDTLKELQEYINSDVEGAATMTQAIAANKTSIENEVTSREQAISSEASARESADNTVRSEFAAADTAIETAYKAADNTVRSEFAAADTAIETAYKAADNTVRSEFAAAITELDNKKADVIDVTPLFEVNGTITGYTFEDLMASKLLYKDSNSSGVGTAVRYVGYGKKTSYSSSIAYLVIDSMVWDDNLRPHNSDAYAYVAQIQYGDGGSIITTKVSDFYNSDLYIFDMDRYMRAQSNSLTATTKFMFDELSYAISKNKVIIVSENAKHSVYEGIDGEETIGLQKINGNYDTSNPTLTYTYYAIDKNMYYCAKYTVDGNMTKIIDVKPLFEVGGTMNGYTLEDLMKYNLWYDYSNSGYNGNAVKYVGYGNAINSKSGEANLVMESFEGATRQISIAHIKGGGITLTTDSVKTYSSNVFVMRVSQVDYDTMKAAGTLDANTLYVIAEVTE